MDTGVHDFLRVEVDTLEQAMTALD